MKTGFTILLLAILSIGCKHNENISGGIDLKLASLQVKQTFDNKNKWLIENQLDSLATIIHPQVVYGHSNCWMQTANDIINASPLDSLNYISIEANQLEINPIGSTAIVSGVGEFIGIYKVDTFAMNLCFVETYSLVENKWMLVARQAAKVPLTD